MHFANPAGLLLGLLAVPIVILHILRPRRTEQPVSSVFLWRSHADPVSSAAPWQRLRWSLLLLAQLLVVGGLALAAADPVHRTTAELAEHTVFVIDTSASMQSLDGHPDRLADAIARAQQLRDQLPAGGIASVVDAGLRPRVVLSQSADRGAFAEAVDALRASAGHSDFSGAFTLAESLETVGVPIGFVVISDGGLTSEEQRLLPPGTRYERIGERSTNRGLVDLRVEPRGAGLHVSVTVDNQGPAARQTLRIDVDGRQANTTALDLPAGTSKVYDVDVPAGDQVQAFLEGEDLLDLDDRAYAVAERRSQARVLVVGPGNVFLDAMLGSISGITFERNPTWSPGTGATMVVFDRVPVPVDIQVPYLAIAPPGGVPGIVPEGAVDQPAIAFVQTDDPLLDGVDLSDVAIATSQRLRLTAGVRTLVASEATPLVLVGQQGRLPFAYFAFAIADTNLPLRVAYPILGDRLIGMLGGISPTRATLTVGQPFVLSATEGHTLVTPQGQRRFVPAGAAAPPSDIVGVWRITGADGAERLVAVNPDPRESQVAPAPALAIPAAVARTGERAPHSERSLLRWFALSLLALVGVEYLLARRRIGVRRKQWRVAIAVRGAVAALLIGALIGLSFVQSADGVATVFLIDASDSVSRAGQAQAVAWVRDALDAAPRGSRNAVALFGGDARLERTLSASRSFEAPTVTIDATRTNLAGALRLAAAVLPTDAKRRIVLLSDGRATQGDVRSEIPELVALGIRVDVVPIELRSGPDVAVDTVELPREVRKGELIPIDAVMTATNPATAVVTLRLDGRDVDARSVALVPGTNRVRFETAAPDVAVARYQVVVTTIGDSVPQNNTANAATRVIGAARVLVLEGAPGEARDLAAALRAGGIGVELTSPNAIPSLDELTTYSAIMLVDVPARELSAAQIATLASATRDLGRGLITIGGSNSYGVGGYYSSELEKLLPVISEILDPKRRQSVAEVLAVDSSGSMAACHCADGGSNGLGGGNRVPGGVTKTDIARSAAARSIAALSNSDEIGLLAFNSSDRWLIDLQKVPADDVVRKGLDGLVPSGGTDLSRTLTTAADKLRRSSASLKHIILFTDGFTRVDVFDQLAKEAETLAAEGITVSVVGTGEGAAQQLESIAKAGGGRFYPGRNLEQIPEIIVQETILAARDFINEGSFFPEIVGVSEATRNLTSAPPLFGYVATTAKPLASTQLRIGPDHDPLLASWQVGLGRAISWTADASRRWSQGWATWSGYSRFWTDVVKSSFPSADGQTAVNARISNGVLKIDAEGVEPFADASSAVARVSTPSGQSLEVSLARVAANRFSGEIEVTDAGSYAVGATVTAGGATTFGGSALASLSYSAEYRTGPVEREALLALSSETLGRGAITPDVAFDDAGLVAGRTRTRLAPWLVLAAALLWPLAVALSRLSLHAVTRSLPGRRRPAERPDAASPSPSVSARPRPEPRAPAPVSGPPPAPTSTPSTVGRLLERKERRRDGA